MGKKARKLRSPKYAAKAAALRETVARLNGRRVIEIDMNTGEETTQEETIEVITNKEPEEQVTERVVVPTPEPQLQTIQIEEPPVNALKATKTRTTKKTTTKKTTSSRKRRTTKTKTVS